jgi:hypothetical protein
MQEVARCWLAQARRGKPTFPVGSYTNVPNTRKFELGYTFMCRACEHDNSSNLAVGARAGARPRHAMRDKQCSLTS